LVAGTCEVCGRRAARYVCQECGRRVCGVCLEPHGWVCLTCLERLRGEAAALPSEALPWPAPFKLFLLGFLLILIGMVFMVIAAVFLGASAGAVIWILPLPPIILGVGQYPVWTIILGVVLTILGAALFLTLRRRKRVGV